MAAIFAIPFFAIVITGIVLFIDLYSPDYDFDKKRWDQNIEKRYQLSDDIIRSKMLIGLSKPEVRALLGDEHNKEDSNRWTYYLGFVPGLLTIDPDVLYIEFKDGKVIQVNQYRN